MTRMGALRAMRSRLKRRNSEALNDKFYEGARCNQDIFASMGTVSVSNGRAFWVIFDQRKTCCQEVRSTVAKEKAYAMMAQCLNKFKKACCLGVFPGNTLWHSSKNLI